MSRKNPIVTGTLDDPKYLTARGKVGAAALHSTETMLKRLGARELTSGEKARMVEVARPTTEELVKVLADRAPILIKGSETHRRLAAILASAGKQ